MKRAGIGQGGDSYDQERQSGQGRPTDNKYFYARRMCSGGKRDYLCIVLQLVNRSCQEFWEDSAPTSWHKDYKI